MSNSGPSNKTRRNLLAAALAAGATAPAIAKLSSANSLGPNMGGRLLPQPKKLVQDLNWDTLIGGQIFTYAAGTLTPKVTYQDAELTLANTNPTAANSHGETAMYGEGAYRMILKDAAGNIIWDRNNIVSPSTSVQVAITEFSALLSAISGSALVGWAQTGIGAIKRTVQSKLRDGFVTPEDFGAVGDGVSDDYEAITRAFATGRNVDFQSNKIYRTTRSLHLNISTLAAQKYQSQTINLNGSSFIIDPRPSDTGSFIFINSWPLVLGTRFIINGGGARISTTSTKHIGDAVAFSEGCGNQVRDIDARGFLSAVHLYISAADRWCESMVIERVRGSNLRNGIRSTIVGGGTGSSFDQTHLTECEFNLNVNGAVAYNLDGFHGRSTLQSCGAWPNEDDASGCVAFRLNGNFANGHMIGCWADGGATADNTFRFGPAYTCLDEANSSMGNAMTIIGNAVGGDTANYLKLPPGWQYRLKVLDHGTVYGSNLWRDELTGKGTLRTAAPGSILQFSGQFSLARGASNKLYQKSIELPSGVRRVQHAVITPYANGVIAQALSAGTAGIFSIGYTAGKPSSIVFYAIPTNLNGTGGTEGCAYMYDICLQME